MKNQHIPPSNSILVRGFNWKIFELVTFPTDGTAKQALNGGQNACYACGIPIGYS